MLVLIAFIFLALSATAFGGEEAEYVKAALPVPVLNTPHVREVFGGEDGRSVKVDEKGHIREIEFIAFPGTRFRVVSRKAFPGYHMLRVVTDEYPAQGPLYVDSRSTVISDVQAPSRDRAIPSKQQIITALYGAEGAPYLWGGNYVRGTDEMLMLYPPSGEVDLLTLSLWRLEGVDCSGLLYEASRGNTPRNTSWMTGFGDGLRIEELTADEISRKARPLDLLVWPGHVVIVLDDVTAIESTHPEGVVTSNLVERIKEIMSERVPLNEWDPAREDGFVLRRWYDSYR